MYLMYSSRLFIFQPLHLSLYLPHSSDFFEESMALKEADSSDDICVQWDGSNAAYPIHQFIDILPIESMIDELYESV